MLLMHEAAGPGSVPSWLSFIEHPDLLDGWVQCAKIVVAEGVDVLDERGCLLWKNLVGTSDGDRVGIRGALPR